jgi:hypothetical protein
MTNRTSAVAALDDLFRLIRTKADQDEKFAAELIQALDIPVKIEHEPKNLAKNLPYYDPVVLAGSGLEEFRSVFRPMTDAQLRKIIVHFNIASKDAVPAKNGPKGEELFEILWNGAKTQRSRLIDR